MFNIYLEGYAFSSILLMVDISNSRSLLFYFIYSIIKHFNILAFLLVVAPL